LATSANRTGGFSIFVNTGGTLSNGVITGGTRSEWWFKDGTADGDLVEKGSGGGDVDIVNNLTETTPGSALDATQGKILNDSKAPLASPTFTGTPAAPTAAADTNTTQLATTAYVIAQGYAKLASPALSGTPTAPTASGGTNSTQIATTAFVVAGYQPLDSDLTDIAGLSPSNDDFIQRKSGAWTNRTVAQVKSDLALNNVDNTSDSTKNAATATLTNKTISGADNTLSNIPQSAVTNLVSDLGNKVGNDTDTYTSTPKANQIITLTQTEYDAIGTPDVNTLYYII